MFCIMNILEISICDCSTLTKLVISSVKSHGTLISPDTHQSHHLVKTFHDNYLVLFNITPKIKGLTLDMQFIFSPHIIFTSSREASQVRIIRPLALINRVHSLESLLSTYRSVDQPTFNYAVPIFRPNYAVTFFQKKLNIYSALPPTPPIPLFLPLCYRL